MTKNLTILVFAPHSAIWVYAFPEALIAEALQQENHRIIYITCGEEFKKYCIPMRINRLEQSSSLEKKQEICRTCNKNKEIIKSSFNFEGYDISDLITPSERAEIELIINKTTPQNFLELELDNIAIGRTALYELLLQYKKNDLNFSETEWSSYLIALRNTLASFFASRKIIEREQPDRVLTFNSLYSVNRVCCQLAESRGIPTYFIHAGENLSNQSKTILLGAKSTFAFYKKLSDYWSIYKDIPCSAELLKSVTDHFLVLFQGKHLLVYSSAKTDKIDIPDLFKIRENQKILVATMSSYDEIFAGETTGVLPQYNNLIFSEQIDWIKFLIEFIKHREDLFLIIRVHPREFPNKRDSVRSAHSQMLEQVLIDLPVNVKLNLPSDNLSIYNLAEYTDLFLNAWSSVGEEMSLLGIPVLIYSRDLVWYTPDINYVATSKEDFCQKIDIALADGWSFERIRTTYRWYVLKFVRSIFDVSDSIEWDETQSTSNRKSLINFGYRAYRKIVSTLVQDKRHFDYRQRLQDCKKRSTSLRDKSLINKLIEDDKNLLLDLIDLEVENPIDLDIETQSIQNEISRLLVNPLNKNNENNTFTPLRENLRRSIGL
jgi:hypothetical protein